MSERLHTVPASTHPCACVADHRPTSAINHWHHVVPLSWGGPDTRANTVVLCPTGHTVVHATLDRWKRQGHTDGPGRMNRYLYDIALRGWEGRP